MNKSNKARLVVYSDAEKAEHDRIDAALRRTPTERFDFLMRLIKLSFMLKGDFSKDISGYKYIIKAKGRKRDPGNYE